MSDQLRLFPVEEPRNQRVLFRVSRRKKVIALAYLREMRARVQRASETSEDR